VLSSAAYIPSAEEVTMTESASIRRITSKLIGYVSNERDDKFTRIKSLDLHLRDEEKGKIWKIENLHLVPNLLYLNLSYNHISHIEGLGCLRSLIELNLAENVIEAIENLETLTSLERLNVSGNRIQRIPSSISTLRNLTELRLARNDLHVVQDIANLIPLGRLKNLRIDENPLFKDPLAAPFTIHSLAPLRILNGHTITDDDREESKLRFDSQDAEAMRKEVCLHHAFDR
jgi:hypothetical protein